MLSNHITQYLDSNLDIPLNATIETANQISGLGFDVATLCQIPVEEAATLTYEARKRIYEKCIQIEKDVATVTVGEERAEKFVVTAKDLSWRRMSCSCKVSSRVDCAVHREQHGQPVTETNNLKSSVKLCSHIIAVCSMLHNTSYLQWYRSNKPTSSKIIKADNAFIAKEAGKKKSDRKFGPRTKGKDYSGFKTEMIHAAIQKDGSFIHSFNAKLDKRKISDDSTKKTSKRHKSTIEEGELILRSSSRTVRRAPRFDDE